MRPTISPGDEHRQDREDQHAVQPGAHAPEDDFAQLHQPERPHPAQRREGVVHGVYRAVGGRRGRGGPEGGAHRPEASLLPLHVAAGLRGGRRLVRTRGGERRVAALLGRDGGNGERGEQDGHGGEDGPSLPVVLHHSAEGEAERPGNQEDGHQLEQVADGTRVLEGVRRIDVEEPAAVRAELLDGHLAGGRSDGDGLGGDDGRVRLERLDQRHLTGTPPWSAPRPATRARARGPPRAGATRRAPRGSYPPTRCQAWTRIGDAGRG